MTPDVRLILGDCMTVLPTLATGSVDAVVTDPPWGIDADTDYTRFVGGTGKSRDFGPRIEGDTGPFDAAPWLRFPIVALWGANCFADQLPMGCWLVWVKRRDSKLGSFMSDAELCWTNRERTPRRAPGVYVNHHVWDGFDRESERIRTLHPTQKPLRIMAWTLEMAGVKPGMTVLDPYMGSGTTGVAAVKAGMNFIGIEKDPHYFAIAQRRLKAAETPLFAAMDWPAEDSADMAANETGEKEDRR